MKKNYFLVFIALCLLFASCSKKSDTKPQKSPVFSASALYGRWLLTKKHYRIYKTPSSLNPATYHVVEDSLFKDTTFNVDLTNKYNVRYLILNSNGIADQTNFPFSFAQEPPLKGDTLRLNYQKVDNSIKYYVQDANSTLLFQNTILSVNDTSLGLQSAFFSTIGDFTFPGINHSKYYYQFEDDFYTKQ
ncbi:MAG: hypothetical protein M3O71_26130 [Bacteroidota bacterium]|nr:hypothetical protein [Bacteroidota bacterium]